MYSIVQENVFQVHNCYCEYYLNNSCVSEFDTTIDGEGAEAPKKFVLRLNKKSGQFDMSVAFT